MKNSRIAAALTLFLLILTTFMVGCSRSRTPESALAQANESNMQRLANLYLRYQSEHGWKGPENEQQFRDYIANSVPDFIKERIGIANIDELFVNERDGQPFKIRFEIQGSAKGCSEPAIFEQTGSGGKRMVAFLNMFQRPVDETEYEDLWNGKLGPPQS